MVSGQDQSALSHSSWEQGQAETTYVVCTDCEGGPVRADHARELASDVIIPDGKNLFDCLSTYDDYAAYGSDDESYNVGNTLRLLLPFLKANGLTNKSYATSLVGQDIPLSTGAKEATALLNNAQPTRFQITTTYRPYAELVGQLVGVPASRIYATPFDLDSYYMDQAEREQIRAIAQQITDICKKAPLPRLATVPPNKPTLDDAATKTFNSLESLLSEELGQLPCACEILSNVVAMGGKSKVAALHDALIRSSLPITHAIFVGDSITDYEILLAINEGGGAAIAFNGSEFAVSAATHVCWGNSYVVAAIAAEMCRRLGRPALDGFARSGGKNGVIDGQGDLLEYLTALPDDEWGIALNDPNDPNLLERLVRISQTFRSETLGPDLGKLP